MHEMSIAVELMRQLEQVAAEHNVERIEEFTVQTGAMWAIVPDSLELAFKAVAEGTCAEAAKMNLDIIPVSGRCRCCGRRFEPDIDSFLCKVCNQADVEIVEGNDITLKSVTFEQKRDA